MHWKRLCMALGMLGILSLGCTGELKETKIKCPKCGYYFSTKEGADFFNWSRGAY
jgi:hypothetical protein